MNGTAKSSIASRLIQKMQDDGDWSEENQDLAMCVLGTIFGGESFMKGDSRN